MKKIELDKGFLDDKMNIVIEDIKNKYKEEIKLLYAFNDICYKVIGNYKDLEIDKTNEELLYLLPAFIEINKQYQSAIIMLEYGFENNFESILRNIFELSFQMLYVFQDSNNMYRLEKRTYSKTMEKLKYIDENKLYDILPKDLLDNQNSKLEKNKEELKNLGIKNSPEIKDICKMLNMERDYSYYRYLSDYVHCDYSVIMSLSDYTDKGLRFQTTGNYDNFSNNSLRLIYSIELVLNKMINKIAPTLKDEHKKLVDEFNNFAKKNKR